MTTSSTGTSGRRPLPPVAPARGQRELIVIANEEAGLRARAEGVLSATGADVSALSNILTAHGAKLTPLFGASEERLQADALHHAAPAGPAAHLFYHVDAPDDRLDELAAELLKLDAVEAAYVKPAGELPSAALPVSDMGINTMLPMAGDAPPTTPDFIARQLYLEAAPGGIDVRYALANAAGRRWRWRAHHRLRMGLALYS